MAPIGFGVGFFMRHAYNARGDLMRNWLRFIALMAACLSPFLFWYDQNFRIRVRTYELHHAAIRQPVRILHISDLHGMNWGDDNALLIRRIAAQQPDLICVTGDMYTRGSMSERRIAEEMMAQLCDIAPVCFVPGEHDRDPGYLQSLASMGVLIPDATGILLDIARNPLRIRGCSAAWFPPGCDLSTRYSGGESAFELLLCHIPVPGAFSGASIDLMLSGDTHGGLLQLPMLGTLYDGARWLPEWRGAADCYIHGAYAIDGMTLLVTSGLGGLPVRLFAPPEICVIDLLPE